MAQNVTLLQLNIMIVIIIKIMTLIMIMIFSAWYTLQTLPTGAQQRQRETLCSWQDVGHWCVTGAVMSDSVYML